MNLKHYFLIILCLTLAIFSAIIATGVSDAIETRSLIYERRRSQELKQRQAEWEMKQEEEAELLEEKIALKESVLGTLKYLVPMALTAILLLTIKLYHGWTDSEVKKAHFQATQLRLDERTRTYPILCFEAGGKFRLHNPNTGQTLALEENSGVMPLLMDHGTAVQLQSMAGSNQMVDTKLLIGGR